MTISEMDDNPAGSTRSKKKPKQVASEPLASKKAAPTAAKKQVRRTSGSAKATKNTRGAAPRATTKNPSARQNKSPVTQDTTLGDDSDVLMDEPSIVERPKKKVPNKSNKQPSLKRKSDAQSALGAIAGDIDSDLNDLESILASTSARPSKKSKTSKSLEPTKPNTGAAKKNAVIAAEKAVLSKENEDLKAALAAAQAENTRLQYVNEQTHRDYQVKSQLIPRPPGERGKNGWNLQAHMGLAKRYELYSNIRRSVRYAIYESQLNIWKKINHQDEQALFTCYALIKQQFPIMVQFEGNWATREFIKGICQNARRHCRKKGITNPTLPAELLDGDNNRAHNSDDGEDDGEGEDGEDEGDEEEDAIVDDEVEGSVDEDGENNVDDDRDAEQEARDEEHDEAEDEEDVDSDANDDDDDNDDDNDDDEQEEGGSEDEGGEEGEGEGAGAAASDSDEDDFE
ncbi:hypothetical protein FRB90_002050 [Tulasnella sp. 427]|nr:hypothetical protein FRB90_002050 [Tulasnella sp. 427]